MKKLDEKLLTRVLDVLNSIGVTEIKSFTVNEHDNNVFYADDYFIDIDKKI